MANTTYETIGRVQQVTPEQVISEKMKKRILVIETNEQYPQLLQLEAVNDNCSRLDNLKAGDEVKVEFQVRGRKWQDKFFTSLQIWKLHRLNVTVKDEQPKAPEQPSEDLPF